MIRALIAYTLMAAYCTSMAVSAFLVFHVPEFREIEGCVAGWITGLVFAGIMGFLGVCLFRDAGSGDVGQQNISLGMVFLSIASITMSYIHLIPLVEF